MTALPAEARGISHRDRILTAAKHPDHNIDFDAVPVGLQSLDRWFCWKWEWNGKKWSKIPVQTNGRNASSTGSETWTNFASAAEAAKRNSWGLGFALGDGIAGIDLDDCRDPESGELLPWAAQFLLEMKTYAEVSPSETGIKILLTGMLPEPFNKKHKHPSGYGEVEIYQSGRFFTITGKRAPGTPHDIAERSEALSDLYKTVSGWKPAKPAAAARQTHPQHTNPSDDVATALAALAVLDPDMDYEGWLSVGMCLHSVDPSEAMLAEFDSWSRGSDKYVTGDCEAKWKSFGGDGVTIRTLCHRADQTGQQWRPARAQARLPEVIESNDLATDSPRIDQSAQQLTTALTAATRQITSGIDPAQVLLNLNCRLNAIDVSGGERDYETLTSVELDDGEFSLEYLIPGLLAGGQPCILAGPKKCLKTNILIDLTLSLSSGCKFLNEFVVTRGLRVALISGESGKATIQETCRRIAKSKPWFNLREYGNAFWCFDLPKLGQPNSVRSIVAYVKRHELELLIIDPAYLAMPLGDSASNLFLVGAMLNDLTKVSDETGVTIILCHHARKGGLTQYDPPELENIAWAGFQEWARQWLLLGRRAPYDPDSGGHHELWLASGGSAGHSGLWALDITEGTRLDECGRRWDVTVSRASQAKQQKAAERDQQKEEREQQHASRNREKVLTAYRKHPSGETKSMFRELSGVNSSKFNVIHADLLEQGIIEPCEITKNKRPEKAFRLTEAGWTRLDSVGLDGSCPTSPTDGAGRSDKPPMYIGAVRPSDRRLDDSMADAPDLRDIDVF